MKLRDQDIKSKELSNHPIQPVFDVIPPVVVPLPIHAQSFQLDPMLYTGGLMSKSARTCSESSDEKARNSCPRERLGGPGEGERGDKKLKE